MIQKEIKTIEEAVRLQVPKICLLHPEFGQKRHRDTCPSGLWPSINLFSTRNLWDCLLSCPLHPGNSQRLLCVCVLRFLLTNQKLSGSLELFHPGGGRNLHLQTCYTYLSLAFQFNRNDAALGGMDHFLLKLVEKKLEGAQHPGRCKISAAAASSSRM